LSAEDLTFHAHSFSGRVRLFPLPNLVMFPHVLQPLHIFEPRYRALFEEALADDRLIAMAVLAPGWEDDYEGRPPLRPTACLGRIVTHQAVDGGRYNLLLAGLKRVRLVHELPAAKPFREARVELVDDVYSHDEAGGRAQLQRLLLDSFRRVLPSMPKVHEQLEELLCTDVSLGMLTDLIAYTLQLPVEIKESLLGEESVDRRCRLLLKELDHGAAIGPGAAGGASPTAGGPSAQGTRGSLKWPPDFSAN
jgi:ATP-dependent Lon protease